MTLIKRPILLITSALLFFCFYLQSLAYAGSILIWPIDPVIEDEQNATAIWLENQDSKPAYMQIRVLEWQQNSGENQYQRQSDISVSPPFVLIEPGKRQLVRLVKNIKIPANQEKAYRILVDETPRAKKDNEPEDSQSVSIGVKFQMRYSIPLFVSGQGIWTNPDYNKNRDIKTATKPELSYQISNLNGQSYLSVRNDGKVHARLSKLSSLSGNKATTLVDGLVGYVLPGSVMRFPMAKSNRASTYDKLQALINNDPDPVQLLKR
ncbi:molecular chaperone [Budviciaceae bacterium BWR-B9]|uniref:Molecular chaperone n=1 Tax=Limnobaculum allomyrinae TaxID=2791986 RepID=A0ABS1IV20_9GAMM|nr:MULTISPECIES: molecular chaperone [Limnobaculum]MBK5145437.1 molecular chaperone [Limnobaculum allomyrinae]MBV7693135.1 molecular chaperone [Limnobaculum sp. M2-1]